MVNLSVTRRAEELNNIRRIVVWGGHDVVDKKGADGANGHLSL